MKNKKEIERITNQIVKKYKPEKIILFGSYAWGKPTEDSDVDLFIVKKSGKRRIDRERELSKYLFGHNFPAMDILIYTPAEIKKRLNIEDPFVKDIISKGKSLYVR
ncbi:MAG: nucleotidyltransferase domain-containing protein [Patescibacteria group bacterium]|nr:nucleotidyltransferase domain-containing protein [Patescibacteria group bacterium]MBU4141673.1 nucleotidyltransferase domain-containing protein [Patescibacteria group bacterium]